MGFTLVCVLIKMHIYRDYEGTCKLETTEMDNIKMFFEPDPIRIKILKPETPMETETRCHLHR